MKYGIYLTGPFGQSNELYRVRNEAKRRGGSAEAVDAQVLNDTKKIISRQLDAGFDFVVDPMFKFFHLFHPLTEPYQFPVDDKAPPVEKVKGIKPGPQENWFNNNVFYFRPQIQGPIRHPGTSFSEDYLRLDLLPQDGRAMTILPSPYTLMMLSNINGYENQRAILRDLGQLIREEAQHLVEKFHIGRIQYDEPVIAAKQSLDSLTQHDLALLQLAMVYCGTIKDATTSLHTYFGDVSPLADFLRGLPVDCIGMDATETRLKDITGKFDGKELAVGLVNARSADIENPRDLTDKLRRLADTTQPRALWLTPNTGTEYIGWTLGLEKIRVLEETKRLLEGR